PVIVHGGGKAISAKMREAGIAPRFVNGLRVTEEASVKIVEETLDGEINPAIVATIQEHGGRAKGLSGKTVFVSRKLPLQRQDDGTEADLGFVGEAEKVVTKEVLAIVKRENVPVISPIGATAEGLVLNINADIAAAALATGLKAHKLIFVSDVPGIMRDPSQKDTLIPTVTIEQTQMLIEKKVIEGGMIPKVESAVNALRHGVGKVHMIGGHIPHCLLLEIFTNSGIGTEIIP
ncbi:MAG: acetylglutamate kinase, partial [Chthoniobacterales bacterium]